MKNHTKTTRRTVGHHLSDSSQVAIERIIESIRELLADDPFVLAAFVDWTRQMWDGGTILATSSVVQRIADRAASIKASALKDASTDAVRAAVQS